jgi:hypothetical protein
MVFTCIYRATFCIFDLILFLVLLHLESCKKLGVYHHNFFLKSRMKFKKRTLCKYMQKRRSNKLNQLPSKYFQQFLLHFDSTIGNVLI